VEFIDVQKNKVIFKGKYQTASGKTGVSVNFQPGPFGGKYNEQMLEGRIDNELYELANQIALKFI
jgi:hypothetical protein